MTPTTPTEWDWDDGPDWKQIRKDHGLPPGSESAIIDIWYEAAAAERERIHEWSIRDTAGRGEDAAIRAGDLWDFLDAAVELLLDRARDAAVGRAVLRLADSVAWTLRGGPDGSNTEAWNTQTGAVGSGDTIPEAIAAALGDDHD